MSDADRGQYAEAVTSLSEAELEEVVSVAQPPVCLLGGWAVHLHANDGFRETQGRPYIGSRDIDLGIHVDPESSAADLQAAPVSTTLDRIETELGYNRGRFGFYQQFHRETGSRPTRRLRPVAGTRNGTDRTCVRVGSDEDPRVARTRQEPQTIERRRGPPRPALVHWRVRREPFGCSRPYFDRGCREVSVCCFRKTVPTSSAAHRSRRDYRRAIDRATVRVKRCCPTTPRSSRASP